MWQKMRYQTSLVAVAITLMQGCTYPTGDGETARNQSSEVAMKQTAKSVVQYVDATKAAQMLKTDKTIAVLDVRTGWEFKRGHIDGATNVNYLIPGFSSKARQLDPSIRYLVVCKTGHRSTRALSRLEKAGIRQLIHLDEGMDGWKKMGLKVSR